MTHLQEAPRFADKDWGFGTGFSLQSIESWWITRATRLEMPGGSPRFCPATMELPTPVWCPTTRWLFRGRPSGMPRETHEETGLTPLQAVAWELDDRLPRLVPGEIGNGSRSICHNCWWPILVDGKNLWHIMLIPYFSQTSVNLNHLKFRFVYMDKNDLHTEIADSDRFSSPAVQFQVPQGTQSSANGTSDPIRFILGEIYSWWWDVDFWRLLYCNFLLGWSWMVRFLMIFQVLIPIFDG